MYYWYKKIKDVARLDMGKFTRILHSGRPVQLMDEIPTFVVGPLPKGLDRFLYRFEFPSVPMGSGSDLVPGPAAGVLPSGDIGGDISRDIGRDIGGDIGRDPAFPGGLSILKVKLGCGYEVGVRLLLK
ncbi:Hydroxyproline O-arabinosyltransferase 3, partial [Mucuna pruriens]